MQIKKQENESLRLYVARLNKEALLIDEVDEMVLVTAFQMGSEKDNSFSPL